MHSVAFRIGLATLTNGEAYPSAAGERAENMLPHLAQSPSNTARVFFGGAATFGTATLQPQVSFDGTNWANLGSALAAATAVAIEVPRSAKIRFLVSGTGNITTAALYIG